MKKQIYLPTGIFIKPVLVIWSSYKRLFTFGCGISAIEQTDSSREDKKEYTFTHSVIMQSIPSRMDVRGTRLVGT